MIYVTPGLERFEVSWHIDPDNVPRPVSEDFLAEKFMEDVLDAAGGAAPSFTITEVRVPSAEDMVDTLVEIIFHIVATVPDAKTMQAYDFEVHPMRDNLEDWKYPDPGLTWGELQRLLAHDLGSREVPMDQEALFTDDEDSDAPWYRVRTFKKHDRGWFLALEIVE